ncbi:MULTISPECIES: hypothetical protein [Dickeya]|uniref:Acid shock protein n=1 Tax=Dickeya aquatica TaxID=1401087 RepID=A0A375AA94_9GAMM|nr:MULTISPECIES: hypothetical protein [Dickeya]SLM62529.1 hypothetical protein DAQ1742_01566 [Dickeya aquatica]
MNMKPLFLGVILATSYAHAASSEVSAKPTANTSASAVVTSNTTTSQEGKTQPGVPPTSTAVPVKQNAPADKKSEPHKKAATSEKNKDALNVAPTEKAGATEKAVTKEKANKQGTPAVVEKEKGHAEKKADQKSVVPPTAIESKTERKAP